MKPIVYLYLFTGVLMLALAASASAAMSGDSPPPPTGDTEFDSGVAAWQQQDWQKAVEHLTKAIESRPWNDEAHALMGFAYRKLGDYRQSLEHYRQALDLNPHHRGALAYLGEAYLEIKRPAEAERMLERLAVECRRIAATADCEEHRALQTAINAYHQSGHAEQGLDTTATRQSQQGRYQVSYRSEFEPVTINQIHRWVVHLETADGQPVEDAEIAVSGGMPEHDHGLPTAPRVTRYLGNGDYQVEGMKFQMDGWWEVTFDITAGGQQDSVTFHLIL